VPESPVTAARLRCPLVGGVGYEASIYPTDRDAPPAEAAGRGASRRWTIAPSGGRPPARRGQIEDPSASARTSPPTVLDWGHRLPPKQHGRAGCPPAAAGRPAENSAKSAECRRSFAGTVPPTAVRHTLTQPLARTGPPGPGEQPRRSGLGPNPALRPRGSQRPPALAARRSTRRCRRREIRRPRRAPRQGTPRDRAAAGTG
jgi:hypothetical protein